MTEDLRTPSGKVPRTARRRQDVSTSGDSPNEMVLASEVEVDDQIFLPERRGTVVVDNVSHALSEREGVVIVCLTCDNGAIRWTGKGDFPIKRKKGSE